MRWATEQRGASFERKYVQHDMDFSFNLWELYDATTRRMLPSPISFLWIRNHVEDDLRALLSIQHHYATLSSLSHHLCTTKSA